MDEYLSFLIYSYFRNSVFDFVSLILSIFFSTSFLLSFTFVYWFIRMDRKGFFVFSSFLLNNSAIFLLKTIFARPRPLYGAGEMFFSFPSAHASNSFFLAVLFSHYFPKKKHIAYALALMVSLSRVYNGTHYFSDVLFGGLFGYFFAHICLKHSHVFDNLFNCAKNKLRL